jgi:RNA polymerase sigma-70 factor (ECF subfamily)
VHSPEVAEELVHDVFAQLWEQRTTWVVHDTVRRYLFGAVRNRAITTLRRSGVAERWAELAAIDADISGAGQGIPSVDDVVREAELAAALARAVDRLPVRRRQALLLRWQHQRSYVQIADAMGISVKGVEAALAKAIRAVREALDPLL